MKNHQIFIYLLALIMASVAIISCEKDQTDSLHEELIKTWRLVDINYDYPVKNVADSSLCIDGIAYYFIDGIAYETKLNAPLNQPDSLFEYYETEEWWTFFRGDSLTIDRHGFASAERWCEDGKIRGITTLGVPCISINARCELTNNSLQVLSDRGITETYKIEFPCADSLILGLEDKNLVFIECEEAFDWQ